MSDQQQALYDVYFTGKLIDDVSLEQAQAAVAALFKTDTVKIAHIFNGQTHILKRSLSKEAALKYKAALRKAGLSILFKISETTPPTTSVSPPSQAAPKTDKETVTSSPATLSIAPAGADVLTDNERSVFTPANIDTSQIKMASAFTEITVDTPPAPPAPDTSHISIAEIGADLSDKPLDDIPLPILNIDDISLAPVGALLEELHDDLPEVSPDISGISLAPAGSDLLDKQEKTLPPAPDTSHLSIKE